MPTTKKKAAEDRRLTRLSAICLKHPETMRTLSGDHASFRVRKKVFAYFLDNHHGDGVVSVCFKAGQGENQVLAGAEPKRFYIPAYIGPKGWVGLRLDVGAIDWDEVAAFALSSYRLAAPKRLASETEAVSPRPARRKSK